MQKNNKGFAPPAIVGMVLVAVVILFAGWYVYKSGKDDKPAESAKTSESTASADQAATSESKPAPKVITEVDLLLQKPGDGAKLPDVTPGSFVTFVEFKLSTFECDFDEFPEGGYSIQKISDEFISGSLSSCGGGAAIVWYLNAEGWQELGFQSPVPCSELAATKIPSDFLAECYDDVDAESILLNPNGPLNP